MTIQLLHGDCRELLPTLPAQSVQCVITSPPYFGLRKYGDDSREIGQEATPALYVAALVEVFREVWRVLRDDGVLWLNLGDSYAGSWGNYGGQNRGKGTQRTITTGSQIDQQAYTGLEEWRPPTSNNIGIAPKNLIGIPWRVAFALQDAGWILRSDVIWAKPNCMPESVTDRPTRAHEYLFLFAKSARYFYDAAAIAEPVEKVQPPRQFGRKEYKQAQAENGHKGARAMAVETGQGTDTSAGNHYGRVFGGETTRNRRTVWTIATQPFSGAHFATMPEALIEPCILAGSSAQACETCGAAWGRMTERDAEQLSSAPTSSRKNRQGKFQDGGIQAATVRMAPPRDAANRSYTTGFAPRCICTGNTGSAASVVLDPFGGSGTVARVAERYQRNAILIDLNQDYIELQEQRTDKVQIEMFT